MRVATANVQNIPNMTRKQVVADGEALGEVCHVAAAQELGEPRDWVDFLKGLGPTWEASSGGIDKGHFGGRGSSEGVVWDTRQWAATGSEGFIVIHHGVAKISYTRRLVWVDLERVKRPGEIVRFSSTHFAANVFGPGDERRKDYAKRFELWTQDLYRWSMFCKETADAGIAHITMGDFNRGKTMPLPDVRAVKFAGPGIDHIFAIDGANVKFTKGRTGTVDVNSDHHIRWVSVKNTFTPPLDEPTDPIQDVVDAWTITGPNRKMHRDAQNRLRVEWPTLGHSLDALADSVSEK